MEITWIANEFITNVSTVIYTLFIHCWIIYNEARSCRSLYRVIYSHLKNLIEKVDVEFIDLYSRSILFQPRPLSVILLKIYVYDHHLGIIDGKIRVYRGLRN
jgi:hypothetical protein